VYKRQALASSNAPEHANRDTAYHAVMQVAPLDNPDHYSIEYAKSALREYPSLHETFEQLLMPRHPSQLYQAFLEGALIFITLWIVRHRFPKLGHGVLTGLFFVLYAVGRIIGEQFREPDSAMIGALTKGQFYSTFMILIGASFIIWGLKKNKPEK